MSTLAEGLSGRGGPLRYVGAGLVNSGVGYAAILALGAAGAHPFAANAGGFAAGFLVSLILAQRWTFGPAARPAAPVRYAAAFAACYGINLAAVAVALTLGLPDALAQAVGVGAYATMFYLVCRWWVFGTKTVAVGDLNLAWKLASARPGAAAIAASLPIAAAVSLAANPSDVVWQMWIGRQLNGGADLYSGIVEVNPPLWFWMAMPVDRLAATLGIPALMAINLFVAALGASAVGLCAALTRGWETAPGGKTDRIVVLGGAIFAVLIFPTLHFAQREHITLIGALPYLLLLLRRSEGRQVGLATAMTVGALAALGLAMKHYFVLLPIFGEVWRVYRGGTVRAVIRPETVVLGTAAAIYAVSVMLWSRDFFTDMVPLVELAYGGYRNPIALVLLQPFSLICLMLVATAAYALRSLGRGDLLRRRTEALLLGAVVFIFAYAVQSKGFVYHLFPVVGLAGIVGGLLAARLTDPKVRCALGMLTASLVVMAIVHDPDHGLSERTYDYDAAGIGKGTKVLALNSVASLSITAIERREAVWTSRSLGLWPMRAAAIAAQEGRVKDAAAIVDLVAAQVAEDAACNPPDVLLADSSLSTVSPAFEGDIFGVLKAHPATAATMAAFTPTAERGMLTVYRRTGDLPAPPDEQACRTIY